LGDSGRVAGGGLGVAEGGFEAEVVASKASKTATMRDPSGIFSPSS
jgi:hypothetical protein